MSGSEESAEVLNNVVEVFKYGDESLLDGIILVGEKEFHVNKQFLSVRSSVFRILFNSDFKEKTQEKVKIEADEIAFKRMMDLLHFSFIQGDISFIKCDVCAHCSYSVTEEATAWSKKFWEESLALLQLLDRFDCTRSCLPIFESILFFNMCPSSSSACLKCANRMILALHYDLSGFKMRSSFLDSSIVVCMRNFNKFIPSVEIQGKDFLFFLKLLGK